ncbi:recombinase family protein [Phenylobacterium sp.]|uniref:recombinase family protein n=1 Tax=Phenylobacterium sp. TaxID=1871053 RepID=UPI0035C775CA
MLPAVYDDGGYSGGNIERPGLTRLLEDVDAGLVDTIVVYKIDRLTRSLADFARIVDRLDKAQAWLSLRRRQDPSGPGPRDCRPPSSPSPGPGRSRQCAG